MNINKLEIWQALTQLSLRYLKYIKWIFNSNAVWYSYFLILGSHFTKKSEIVSENFFSSSEIAIWYISLKYQEIDVQIQTSTDKDWNVLHSFSFEWY